MQGPPPARGENLLDLTSVRWFALKTKAANRIRKNPPIPTHRKELLALWDLENIPACDEGMELAKVFLESCGEGVDRPGSEEPADRITEIASSYTAMVEPGSGRDDGNEVEKLAIDKANKKPSRESEDDRTDDSIPFGAHELTDEEIEDHDRGVEAGLAGKPNDDTKSTAWQRGWADAQE